MKGLNFNHYGRGYKGRTIEERDWDRRVNKIKGMHAIYKVKTMYDKKDESDAIL